MPLDLGSPLPEDAARTIERKWQLDHFKWDTQVGDTSVLLRQPVLIAAVEWAWLLGKAEQAAREIYSLEQAIADNPTLHRLVGVPHPLGKLLPPPGAPENSLRTLRFDFHPTTGGWFISEVNTDVPGGFGEAGTLPALFEPYYGNILVPTRPLELWGDAVEAGIARGHVALLHAPGHLEDQQVIFALSRELKRRGYTPHSIQNPAALEWRDGHASLCTDPKVRIHLVVRFYQAEWLAEMPNKSGWRELFKRPQGTRVMNPVECVISESKRLPLSFGVAGVACDTLRELFPECRDPGEISEANRQEWVLKAAYSNTGDAIHIGAELTRHAWGRLLQAARRNPRGWVAQRKFETLTLESARGPVRPCLGVFVVGNRAAGAYVRLARNLVTDAHALEAPLFVVPPTAPI